MTMIDQNAIAHLLDGMVKCRRCGTPMGAAGEFLEIWPESGGSRVSGYTWSQQA